MSVGDAVHLTCRARGNPLPTTEWRKMEGEETVLINRGTNGSVKMVIESASSEDLGKYVCIAQNWDKDRHFITLQTGISRQFLLYLSFIQTFFAENRAEKAHGRLHFFQFFETSLL